MTPLFEVKTDLLLRQTRRRLPAFSEGQIEIAPIEKGGSDRRFYRVRCVPEQSLILVKYNLEGAENRHYTRLARRGRANLYVAERRLSEALTLTETVPAKILAAGKGFTRTVGAVVSGTGLLTFTEMAGELPMLPAAS